MVLTGFFDNLMVARLGYESLAAAGICNSIFFLVAVFPMGITMAFATVTGIIRGRNRKHVGSLLFRDALITTLIITLFSTLIMLLLLKNFHIFQQTAAIEAKSLSYFFLLTLSLCPMLIFFFIKNMADGYNFTHAGMIITLLTLVLNVFFNWVFIYGNLGFKAYGLDGAGLATILARGIAAGGMAWLFFTNKRIPIFYIDFLHSFRRKSYHFYTQIIRIGIPTGLQYFFEVAAFAAAAIIAGWMGAKELAAHQLAITLASLSYMFASGLSAGTSIYVASAYGQKNYPEVKRYGNAGLFASLILMMVFALIFAFFNKPLAALFAEDTEVLLLGAQLLILAAVFQLSDGVQAVSLGLLRGIEDVRMPSLITLAAYWVVGIPLGYFLAFYRGMSVNGIWIGLATGLTISAVLLCARFYYLSGAKKA